MTELIMLKGTPPCQSERGMDDADGGGDRVEAVDQVIHLPKPKLHDNDDHTTPILQEPLCIL